MLIIPIGDENPTRRIPYVNYLFIIINSILFLGLGFTAGYEDIVMRYGYIPDVATPYTFFTSIFLHGSLAHLIGNMLYLWIVGDNVEDKLGHVGYFFFYLICGAAANIFHGVMASGQLAAIPTIGASGAISAVLGAYVVLFPKNKIKFFYFFFFIFIIRWGVFKLASFWAIIFWFVLQLFSHSTSGQYSNVAYGAHIGGFITGVIFMGAMVLTGIIHAHWEKAQDRQDIMKEQQKQFPLVGERTVYHERPQEEKEPEKFSDPFQDLSKYMDHDKRREDDY